VWTEGTFDRGQPESLLVDLNSVSLGQVKVYDEAAYQAPNVLYDEKCIALELVLGAVSGVGDSGDDLRTIFLRETTVVRLPDVIAQTKLRRSECLHDERRAFVLHLLSALATMGSMRVLGHVKTGFV
jgi:hypothetical protein